MEHKQSCCLWFDHFSGNPPPWQVTVMPRLLGCVFHSAIHTAPVGRFYLYENLEQGLHYVVKNLKIPGFIYNQKKKIKIIMLAASVWLVPVSYRQIRPGSLFFPCAKVHGLLLNC